MWNVQKVVDDGEEEADRLLSVLTDRRTQGESKRQKKHEIQISYWEPNSLAQLLAAWYNRGQELRRIEDSTKSMNFPPGF